MHANEEPYKDVPTEALMVNLNKKIQTLLVEIGIMIVEHFQSGYKIFEIEKVKFHHQENN